MKVSARPTRKGRALLHEMAKEKRVIFAQKHPRRLMEIQYCINAFPMRKLNGEMIAKLAREGYITLNPRGYFVLTAKGMLHASVVEERKKK